MCSHGAAWQERLNVIDTDSVYLILLYRELRYSCTKYEHAPQPQVKQATHLDQIVAMHVQHVRVTSCDHEN
jgi:hypothetical protein